MRYVAHQASYPNTLAMHQSVVLVPMKSSLLTEDVVHSSLCAAISTYSFHRYHCFGTMPKDFSSRTEHARSILCWKYIRAICKVVGNIRFDMCPPNYLELGCTLILPGSGWLPLKFEVLHLWYLATIFCLSCFSMIWVVFDSYLCIDERDPPPHPALLGWSTLLL